MAAVNEGGGGMGGRETNTLWICGQRCLILRYAEREMRPWGRCCSITTCLREEAQ